MTWQIGPGHAGWYPDPAGKFEKRYFDGAEWTQAVMQNGSVDTDPSGAPPTGAPSGPGIPGPVSQPGTLDGGPPVSPTDRITSLGPADAQAMLTRLLAMQGVIMQPTGPGRFECTHEVKGQPNMLVLVLLILVWIIPGVIYWMTSSKKKVEHFALYFVPVSTGTRIAMQGSPAAYQRVGPALAQLPW